MTRVIRKNGESKRARRWFPGDPLDTGFRRYDDEADVVLGLFR